MKRSYGKPDERLGDQLFALVEYDQGKAFISDGIGVLTREEILGLARASLTHSRIVVRKLERWLKQQEKFT